MDPAIRPLEIDHLMIHVHDVDQAGRLFEQLGFTVTPRSDFLGLSNRLVCFAPPLDACASFLELIAVEDLARAPAAVLAFLPQGEGPASAVLFGKDAHAFAKARHHKDRQTPLVLDLSRDWHLGHTCLSLSFSVCLPSHGQDAISWSYIQHKTPWHYRQPTFLDHANGGVRLNHLLVSADDPSSVAGQLAGIWQAEVQPAADSSRVLLGHTSIRIMTPARLAETYEGVPATGGVRLVGAAIAVKDLGRLRASSPGRWLGNPTGIHLAPQQTLRTLIAFEADRPD